jgi:threonine dehydrogenase-like Zn-dependent dehydrogenase
VRGVYLPGHSDVDVRDLPDPVPGPGQVLLAMKASTICGSDIRAIYREHLQGDPAEMYADVVAGHEPAGEVVAVGPDAVRLKVGDRVCVYHISGCGQCDDCVRGYQISCSSPRRAAYGWQRDGGHADLILAEERDCVVLPDFVTFMDGACVACGFGTAYEGLIRANVSGRDSLAVVGLGPVGLAAGLLGGKLGATPRVGVDSSPERCELALRLGAVDAAYAPDQAADALIGASSPAADAVELHEMRMDGATMRMRAVDRIVVAPGAHLTMAPGGGYHLMFVRIRRPWAVGDDVPVTLVFERAGRVDVHLRVEPRDRARDASAAMHGHAIDH